MRLLDTRTGQFVEKDPRETRYAILSHTWDKVEQTYQDILDIQTSYGHKGRLCISSLPVGVARNILHKGRDMGLSLSRFASSASLHRPRIRMERSARSNAGQEFSSSRLPTVPLSADTSSSHTHPTDRIVSETGFPVTSIWHDPRLSPKVREACAVARASGFQYIWIDSGCIDKTSSSELSEAINSMYQWYAYAEVCYAYLSDVPSDEDPRAWLSRFRRSRWYERGWTLQELIATLTVTFLSKDWKVIGSKHSLFDIVEEITGIPEEALLHTRALDSFSVAQRLSWAAKRRTTRVEDRAYSLLGIFDINMPTLYGEGERAFRRLQEEILRRIPDQSLFAWSNMYSGYVKLKALITSPSKQHWQTGYFCCGTYRDTNCLFGSSPEAFMAAGDIGSISYAALSRLQLSSFLPTEYTPTPQGIRTQMPVIPLSLYLPQNATEYPAELPPSRWYLAILGCEHYDFSGSVLGRVCYLPPSESGIDVLYPGRVGISPKPKHGDDQADLFPLSLDTIERCREQIQLKTVYISHPRRVTVDRHHDLRQPHNSISLMLPKETRRSLLVQGYRATIRGPDQDHPNSHWLMLSSYARTLTIEYQHTLKNDGYDLAISAQVQMHIYSLGSGPISVTWADATPWAPSLSTHEVAVSHGLEDTLTVKLGLGFVMPSHYSLFVEVGGEESTFAASLSRRLLRQDRLVLDRDNGTSVRDGEEEGRVDQVNYYEDTDEDVNVTKSPV